MHKVSCGTVGEEKEKDLAYECYPSGSDEWIERNENEITDEIRDSDNEVYSE